MLHSPDFLFTFQPSVVFPMNISSPYPFLRIFHDPACSRLTYSYTCIFKEVCDIEQYIMILVRA